MSEQRETRNGKEIVVVEEGGRLQLLVDGKSIIAQRDVDDVKPSYFSPRFPYRKFSSLMELGRKVVDES